LAGTVYRQLNKEDKYEAARNGTILSIAHWIMENPTATQVQTQGEVEKQIELFKQKISRI